MIETILSLLVLGDQTQKPKPERPVIPLKIPALKDQFGVEMPKRSFVCYLSDIDGKQYKLVVALPEFRATDHARNTRNGSVHITQGDEARSTDVGVRLEFNEQKSPTYSLKFWLESGSLEEAGHSAVRMYIKPSPFGTKVEMWPNVSLDWRFQHGDKSEHPDNLRVKAAGVCNSISDNNSAEEKK